jgi:AAA domain
MGRAGAGLSGELIWINGPFGVGKTQAAYELCRRLPGSFVCDPEQLGSGLQRMTPPDLRGDFQDLPLWRQGVFSVLDDNLTRSSRVLIVPMTLVNPDYFAEIVGGLRDRGHTVHHVMLLAPRRTLLRRLRSRGEGSRSWGAAQTLRCLDGLTQLDPADGLETHHLTHRAVVEDIARRAGATLAPDRSTPFQRTLRRLRVQLQHVRRD